MTLQGHVGVCSSQTHVVSCFLPEFGSGSIATQELWVKAIFAQLEEIKERKRQAQEVWKSKGIWASVKSVNIVTLHMVAIFAMKVDVQQSDNERNHIAYFVLLCNLVIMGNLTQ